ncbi:MAG TPA: hypothetical protein VEU29_07515 [Actinomycetota bacterium]|nr:hypothetical protein [Actinomycetota bacterium]
MNQTTACPDCGTQNRPGADLCVQCWRALSDDVYSKIPAAAFATTAPSPFETAAPAPAVPAPPPPRRVVAPRPVVTPAPAPTASREAEAGPVPYFAPPRGGATPATGFTIPAQPSAAPAPANPLPWGRLVALAMVLAVLGGGYYFLFGKSSGGFSPEDGAYSVALPDGWETMDEVAGMPGEIDVVVKGPGAQTAIMVGHMPAPPGFGRDQMRQGMGFVQQFMPKLPGLSMSAPQETTLLGPDVTTFEMTASASPTLAPGGAKVHMVFAAKEGSPHLATMIVTCQEAECAPADAAFAEMAKTFEFSG